MKVLQRKDAPVASTWNSESVYESWDAWQADFDAASAELPVLAEFQGQLGTSPSASAGNFQRRTLRIMQSASSASPVLLETILSSWCGTGSPALKAGFCRSGGLLIFTMPMPGTAGWRTPSTAPMT